MYKESQMVKGTAAVTHSSVASEGACGQVISTGLKSRCEGWRGLGRSKLGTSVKDEIWAT